MIKSEFNYIPDSRQTLPITCLHYSKSYCSPHNEHSQVGGDKDKKYFWKQQINIFQQIFWHWSVHELLGSEPLRMWQQTAGTRFLAERRRGNPICFNQSLNKYFLSIMRATLECLLSKSSISVLYSWKISLFNFLLI